MTNQVRVSPKNGDRKVQTAGTSKAAAVCDTKAEAVAVARSMAQNKGAEMIVQNKDGQIGFRNTYGKDPFPPKG